MVVPVVGGHVRGLTWYRSQPGRRRFSLQAEGGTCTRTQPKFDGRVHVPEGQARPGGSAIAEPTFADPEDRAPTAVAVRGELDFATVPDLLARLEGIEGDVDLDCSRLTYLDSNGLDALIGAHRGCEARGSRLTIRGLSGSCLRIVRLAHADALLNLRWP
jgi:anti-sigma B factor antagonist